MGRAVKLNALFGAFFMRINFFVGEPYPQVRPNT